MSKKIKELELNALRKAFGGVRDFVLLQPLKLDAAADYTLRKGLREKKIRVKLVKNTFVKKVFDENGMKIDPGSGPTLLCWGADSAKALGTAVDAMLKQLRPDPKLPEKVKEKTGVADGELMPLAQLKNIRRARRRSARSSRRCSGRVRPSPARSSGRAPSSPASSRRSKSEAPRPKGLRPRPKALPWLAEPTDLIRCQYKPPRATAGFRITLLRSQPARFTRRICQRKRVMASVAELADQLAGLTLVQAVELKNLLKERASSPPPAA
jgi:ribosomal protein L10